MIQEDAGAAWFHNALLGPAGQSKYGSIEGIDIDGKKISPFVSWDAKGSVLLAMMGGLVEAVKERLQRENYYRSFLAIINKEW